MRNITSLSNEEIKNIASLKGAKERYAQKKFVAEGVRTITTLMCGNTKLSALYILPDMLEIAHAITSPDNMVITSPYAYPGLPAWQASADRSAPQIVVISEKAMQKISQATTPSGILAVFELPDNPTPDKLTPGLVLAEISDPGNMGTLIRTAAALNITSIVIVGGTDPFGPKVVQSTAGTIGLLNIFTWDWDMLVNNKGNLKLHALVVKDGNMPNTIQKDSALLIVGSEAHGINPEWLANCDDKITIPMPGNTESLNAAIAGSIAAYQVFAQ